MSLIEEADEDVTLEKFIENEFDPKLKRCIGHMKKDEAANIEFLIPCGGEYASELIHNNLKDAIAATQKSGYYYYMGIEFGSVEGIYVASSSGNAKYPHSCKLIGYKLKFSRTK